jgi:hypothetical protein
LSYTLIEEAEKHLMLFFFTSQPCNIPSIDYAHSGKDKTKRALKERVHIGSMNEE